MTALIINIECQTCCSLLMQPLDQHRSILKVSLSPCCRGPKWLQSLMSCLISFSLCSLFPKVILEPYVSIVPIESVSFSNVLLFILFLCSAPNSSGLLNLKACNMQHETQQTTEFNKRKMKNYIPIHKYSYIHT